ncbi:MAG: hypothetical protein WC055_12050 [Melioribacteraceae bacterium]
MKYTKIYPLGLREGHGSFETFFDLEKYASIKEAEDSNDYVVCDFVLGEDDIKYIECSHIQIPEIKKYHRINYQNFPFGLDVLDDRLASELATSMFLGHLEPVKEEIKEPHVETKSIDDYIKEREEKHAAEKFSFKTHTLRWLFYYKRPNFVMSKNGISSSNMCKECKRGVSSYMCFSFRDAEGNWHSKVNCPFCSKPLIRVENTNISHKLYNFLLKCKNVGWTVLDKTKLVRYCHSSRFGTFGDESYLVKRHKLWLGGREEYDLYKRKWWQYLFIRKPNNR